MHKTNSNRKQIVGKFFHDYYSKKIKGGVKTEVFASFEKSYLPTEGISKKLFYKLCKRPKL